MSGITWLAGQHRNDSGVQRHVIRTQNNALNRVLVVDDDPGTLAGFEGILSESGYDVTTTETRDGALSMIEASRFDVALVDLCLGDDGNGLDLLGEFRRKDSNTRCVIVTGFGSIECAVEAMRLGAVDFVEKPLIGMDVVRVVERALSMAVWSSNLATSGLIERWAKAVVRIIESERDLKTQGAWGRAIGMSPPALRAWCRAVGLSTKRSLDLGRALRAIAQSKVTTRPPQAHLDIVDPRTLKRLLVEGGIDSQPAAPVSFEDVLTRQSLICDDAAIAELRRAIRQRPIASILSIASP